MRGKYHEQRILAITLIGCSAVHEQQKRMKAGLHFHPLSCCLSARLLGDFFVGFGGLFIARRQLQRNRLLNQVT
jgi:hypothetical protein